MEIGPISGVRAVPAVRGSSRRTGQWTIKDIENRAHPDDESYTPNGNESDSGDQDEFLESAQQDEEKDDKPQPAAEKDTETGQVSFFA